MAVLGIRLWPDPVLLKKSELLDPEKYAAGEYDQLIADLFDTLYDSGGIGLAAIQVGVPLRVFVMDVFPHPPKALVNPEIVDHAKGTTPENEGCLSLPGVIEVVPRYQWVKVEATGKDGKPVQIDLKDLEGQCAQHEIDHLDGVTIPDKLQMDAQARQRVLAVMKKGRPKKIQPTMYLAKK